jgi:hypothetical protein
MVFYSALHIAFLSLLCLYLLHTYCSYYGISMVAKKVNSLARFFIARIRVLETY